MKILQIAFNSPEVCIHIANALVQQTEVCLMLPRVITEPYLPSLDPAVNYQPFDKPRFREPWRQVALMRTLLKRIDQVRPDLIHMQKGHMYFAFMLPYLRRKYPLVISVHDPRQHIGDQASRRTPQAIMDFAYRQAHRVIAHNDAMKQMIVQELGIPAERIDVTPMVALEGLPSPQPTETEATEILFFGRIWTYKGLAYLIQAEPLITARVPEAKIVIAGQGEDLEPYRRMMTNPDKFIIYNEWISNQQRAELFSRASVVVLPYIEATQSGIIRVAYSHSKPVVASEVGGLPSQVDHGRTGFLVPPGDVQALASRIIQLLEDKSLRHQLGRNGKQKLETEWSASNFARQTMAVYRRTLESARLSPHKKPDAGSLVKES